MNLTAALDIINFAHIGIADPGKRIVKGARLTPGGRMRNNAAVRGGKGPGLFDHMMAGRGALPMNPPSHPSPAKPKGRWFTPKGKTPAQQRAIDADLAGEAAVRKLRWEKNNPAARVKKGLAKVGMTPADAALLAGGAVVTGGALAYDIHRYRKKKAKEAADAAELQRLRAAVGSKKSLAAAMDTINLTSGCMSLAGQPVPTEKDKKRKNKKLLTHWSVKRSELAAKARPLRMRMSGQAASYYSDAAAMKRFDKKLAKRIAAHKAAKSQLAAALDTINFVANPSGDPRPRNRQGQFANPEVDTDPVQQNKAAYDPAATRRRRNITRVVGGAVGVGAGLGLLKLRSVMKKVKGNGAPIA